MFIDAAERISGDEEKMKRRAKDVIEEEEALKAHDAIGAAGIMENGIVLDGWRGIVQDEKSDHPWIDVGVVQGDKGMLNVPGNHMTEY